MILQKMLLCCASLLLVVGCSSSSDSSPDTTNSNGPADVVEPVGDTVTPPSVDGGSDDDGSPDEGDPVVDDGSPDEGDPVVDDGSPDEDNPVVDDGSQDEGDPVVDDGSPDEVEDPVATNTSVINGDNYIDLSEYIILLNIEILATRSSSPVLFLDRFPPAIGNFIEMVDGLNILISGDCPDGGSFERVGFDGGPDGNSTTTYDSCVVAAETLNGSAYIERSSGESLQEYDLELSATEAAEGPGTTVFKGMFIGSCDFCTFETFDVENYSRDGNTDPFVVSGKGSYSASFDNIESHSSELSVRLRNDAEGPINLDVKFEEFQLINDVPSSGAIQFEAQDGSRVDITVPDGGSGSVAVTRTTKDGDIFGDTVSWTDLYQP
ncbi:MAG: hypothetical protein AB8B87_19885 [Granulosicoccus sp.]